MPVSPRFEITLMTMSMPKAMAKAMAMMCRFPARQVETGLKGV